jgi:D-3-phosphoglycerate dehydrogenase
MNKRILISDEVHPLLVEGLTAEGFLVDYRPQITQQEVFNNIELYEGLIVNSKVYVGKEMMDKGQRLKFICRAGSGLEVFDLDYAKQKEIIAFNSPEGNSNAVAEFSLGVLLNLMRNVVKADKEVRNNEWIREANRGEELKGKTVGLIAFGNTGRAFANLLRGFDVNILAYDKYLTGYSDKYVAEAALNDIFEQADILSLHLPLTIETTHMINYGFLSSFRKAYWLVNTSRGKVLKTSDLLKCINEGRIKGAALDVLENERIAELNDSEKNIFKQLTESNRFVLSPHIAGWTTESKQKIAETLLYRIKQIYNTPQFLLP